MNSSLSLSQIATPETPWLGLRSFTEDAHAYFFGRQTELEDLYGRIVDKPLTIFFGQSGLGKSSLIQAALTPSLRRQGFLPVRIRIDHEPDAPAPEEQMLHELQHALYGEGFATQADMICEGLADPAFDAATFLWLLFHDPVFGFLPGASSPPPRPVFLIDQFEEIFTLGERPARRSVSHGFREAIAALVENRPTSALRARLESDDELSERINYRARTARVLLSLREDFLHVLERWRRFMPSLMENRLELRMLNGTQALEAVVRPGQLRDGSPAIVPDEVGHAIVRFVAGVESDVPLAEIDAVPPLLSLVCAELNSQRLAAGETQVSRAQFEGHSDEILRSFYRRSFDPASYGGALAEVPDARLALQALQRLIEEKLLSPDGFRESIAFDTIARELSRAVPADTARHLLTEIVERRLLTVEERGGVRRLELAHDVLAPIVRASRDERQESEALAHAKREQERAESEARGALQQRNRLRRLVGLSLALTAVAFIAAAGALFSLKRAREATEREKQAAALAVEAKKAAEAGFESAFAGLKAIYDEYNTQVVGNTPGISLKEAGALGAGLRAQLVPQLERLHKQQPDHRECLQMIARLAMDELLFINNQTKDWDRAGTVLEPAITMLDAIESPNVRETEIKAELYLWRSLILWYKGEKKQSGELTKKLIQDIEALKAAHPESWRIKYVGARLKNAATFDNNVTASAFLEVAKLFTSLRENSGRHFDVLKWEFVVTCNAYYEEKDWRAMPLAELQRMTTMFDDSFLQNSRFSLVQIEEMAQRLENLTSRTARALVPGKNARDMDARRAELKRLDELLAKLESRLPKSPIVYSRRGEFFALEQECFDAGLEIRSKEAHKFARTRHNERAAAIGVAGSIRDSLIEGFKKYAEAKEDVQARDSALRLVSASLRDVGLLDLPGFDALVNGGSISEKLGELEEMPAEDPMLPICIEIMNRFLDAFSRASVDSRESYLANFANNLDHLLRRMRRLKADNGQILAIWDRCFANLPHAKLSSGDKSGYISCLKISIIAMIKEGRTTEAKKTLIEALQLCDRQLVPNPWDWYGLDAYGGLCMDVAACMKETGQLTEEIQPLLRRGWKHFAAMYGKEDVLERVRDLPLKGELPLHAAKQDSNFFAKFMKDVPPEAKDEGMKRFTIPTDFNGVKFPFHVYIISGPNGLQQLLNQFRWVKEIRGGTVPEEVVTSFTKLWNIAQENKVSWVELCVYALGTAAEEEKKKEAAKAGKPAPAATPETPESRFQSALEAIKQLEDANSKDASTANKEKLSSACVAASDAGLHVKRWADSERLARRAIELDPDSPPAHGNLATALLFQGKRDEALRIYKAHWDDPLNGESLGSSTYADFAALAKEGITHPDTAWIKKSLPQPKTVILPPPAKEPRNVMIFTGKNNAGNPIWSYWAIKPEFADEVSELDKANKLDWSKMSQYGELIAARLGTAPSDDIIVEVAKLYKMDLKEARVAVERATKK